jgi:hypothetical protein
MHGMAVERGNGSFCAEFNILQGVFFPDRTKMN